MVNDYYRGSWGARGGLALALLLSCVHVEPAEPSAQTGRPGRVVRHVQLPAGGAKHPRVELLPVHPLATGSSLSPLSAASGADLSRVS